MRASAAAIKDRVKLLLGAIVHPIQARRWRRFVRAHAVLSDLALLYPRVIHKIHRPYLSRDLGCAGRVDVLIGHYRRLFDAGLGELVRQAASHALPLGAFAGKSGAAFALQLGAIHAGHREGELTVTLTRDGRRLYTASVVLVTDGGEPAIALGSLQGLHGPDGAELIKAATRDLHGCRPKKLMVAVVRALGLHLGATRMVLVSNRNRVAVNRRRASRISADYDETWGEMGALRRADGNFELPCAQAALELDKVPSHKRALARRRDALLAAICAAARATLDTGAQAATQAALAPPVADPCARCAAPPVRQSYRPPRHRRAARRPWWQMPAASTRTRPYWPPPPASPRAG
jgi:uncharacterized protein VirK/YbjX